MSSVTEMAFSAQSQLDEITGQLRDLSARVQRLESRLQTHELNLRPESHRWSIAECVVHLSLTSAAYLAIIRAASEEARIEQRRTSGGPFHMDWTGKLIKFACEPPARVRRTTVTRFNPLVVEPLSEVVPDFLMLQTQLIDSINESNGLDLTRIQVSSTFSDRIHYNLFACFHIVAAHQRRHLHQAEAVKTELNC